jgi:ComF family protein
MGGRNVKNTMIDNMLGFVAPHLCCGCGKIGSLLCDHCKYDIINDSFSGCIACKSPTLEGICRNHRGFFEKAWVVGERRGALQRLIGGFKFQNMKSGAKELALLLDERLPHLSPDTVLVPVPTASSHVRERGYDHTNLITQYLAYMRGLKVDKRVISRKDTKTQHSANRADRIKQAVGAFQITGNVSSDHPYLVIDDVYTTGSTIKGVTRLLSLAGARNVWVAIVARQPLD